MKIVINGCYGGFGLSEKGCARYMELSGKENVYSRKIYRDDPFLIQVVEEMGPAAADRFAELRIIEIPDDVDWQIEEYDGLEWIAEAHRTWGL
jgi:hypothetical protein